MLSGRSRAFTLLGALMVAFTMVSTDFAEARRGGSFGSRGSRTFQQAPATPTAPNAARPVERSMSPTTAPNAATRQQTGATQQRPGLFGGFGGSLMRGMLIGGLLGMLLGYGFGGMAGMLGFLVQLLLVGLVVMLALRFFRLRSTPVTTGGPGFGQQEPGSGSADIFGRNAHAREQAGERSASRPEHASGRAGSFAIPGFGGAAPASSQDIELGQADLDTFERLLGKVQAAFAEEDHTTLRRLCTPEMVSFFSEELADNAKSGMRNDVTGVRLLQADIAEAWREDGEDYATAAFRYESVDLMRDRATGKVLEGDETAPSETTELWTFVRRDGKEWKLSAIQETDQPGA
jgi:predicted lipid-binding transport protein (Tim44 family)